MEKNPNAGGYCTASVLNEITDNLYKYLVLYNGVLIGTDARLL